MPNWVKKTGRKAKKVLAPDEEIQAAMFIRPRGEDGAKKFGAPGGALSKIERLADEAEGAAAAGVAGRFPGANAVVAVTDRRLLVFGHNALTGSVRWLEAEFDRDEISAMTVDGKAGRDDYAMRISFADESSVEVTPGTRLRRFLDAWGFAPAPSTA